MSKRRFNASISQDRGDSWKKAISTGWAVFDEQEEEYGFNLTIDHGDILTDVELTEKQLRLMGKDINRLKELDDAIRRGTERMALNNADPSPEDKPE